MNRRVRRSFRAIAVLALSGVVLSGCPNRVDESVSTLRSDLPLVVVASPSAVKWSTVLRAGGVSARVGTLDEMVGRQAGVVPSDVVLDDAQRTALSSWVEQGGHVVTSNRPLGTMLGFDLSSAEVVTKMRANGVNQPIKWPDGTESVDIKPGSLNTSTALQLSDATAVMMRADSGAGKIVMLGVDPVADGLLGYERFPTLARTVRELGGSAPAPLRTSAEVYVDPGSLKGPDGAKLTPVQIAERLDGVRVAHLAGWNFDFVDPAADYPYDELIDELHRRGILVYAWLEPPFVNLRMWQDWPQCRQKTATGRDAQVDWRYLIALEDPVCFDAAWASWNKLLTGHNWDGINVAELYYEPNRKLDNFTPFSAKALEMFQGDPLQELERFFAFRTNLVTELNDKMLAQLNGLPRANEMDFQLTIIDDHLDPDLAKEVGSSLERLGEVARRRGATLQIEDPFTQWTNGPLRYDKAQSALDQVASRESGFFDVNVVDRSVLGEFPLVTDTMTGNELGLALTSASRVSGRVGIYSLGSLGDVDRPDVPQMIAGSVQVTDSGVIAPWDVEIPKPSPSSQSATVDGIAWPVGSNGVIIPAGEHQVVWSDEQSTLPGLNRCTGTLAKVSATPTELKISYSGRLRTYISVSQQPREVLVDGSLVQVTSSLGPHGWVLALPSGAHTAELRY